MQSLWMLVAALLFAVIGVTIKLAAAAGYGTAELVFYRSVIGCMLATAAMAVLRIPIRTAHTAAHLKRGVASTVAISAFMYAVVHLPLSTAVTLNFTAPLWVALILALVFGENLSRIMLVALAVGFIGIVLLLQPVFTPDKRFDVTIGLLSGMAAAIGVLNVRRLGGLGEPDLRIFWWFTAIISIASGLWLVVFGGWKSHSMAGAGWVLAMAVAATAGQLAQTRAYSKGKAMLAANLSYAAVPFSALAGVLLYDDRIPVTGWLAMGMVILSGIMATWRTRRSETKAVVPEPPTPST